MLPKEVLHLGDGILQARPEFLKKILVDAEIDQHYVVEEKPFARSERVGCSSRCGDVAILQQLHATEKPAPRRIILRRMSNCESSRIPNQFIYMIPKNTPSGSGVFRGNFGTVRRATHKETGIKYAAKFLRRRRRATCWIKQIQHEIAVLMLSSDSKQIVKLHAVYETRNEFVLVLEMASGDLQAILDDDGSLTEQKTRNCIREVLKALDYLHRRNVAHLDIKPQNILLNTNNLEDGLKLCDFGFSRAIEGNSNVCEIQGTPDFVAPEIIQYDPLSLKTDIWSIGVLTYVLLSGFSPYGSDDKQETFLNITQCNLTFPDELFEDVSDDAIDFMKATMRLKAFNRPSVFECLNHKWLTTDAAAPEVNSPPVLHVQNLNVTITTIPFDNDIANESDSFLNFDEDKENSVKALENGDKETSTITAIVQHHIVATNTKLRLEKSSSISLFPDAPTTPKVCRKAPCDENPNSFLIPVPST